MIYSIPYDILIVFLMVLAIIYYQRKDEQPELCHRLLIVGVVVFYVFFAFRGLVFTDWTTYYSEFEFASWSKVADYQLKFGEAREPLYLLLLNICKSLVDSYDFFVIVDTTIAIALIIRFFSRYTDNVLLALVIFMAFSGVEIICNLMRNIVAIGIFLNAIPYLQQRRPLPYFGMCLLAIGFHFSAVIYLPLYFFFHFRMNKWVYLGIFTVCIAIFVLHIPIMSSMMGLAGIGGDAASAKLDAYSEMSGSLGFGLGFLERLGTGLLVFCYFDKLNELSDANRIFINALVAYFISMFVLSEFAEVGKRISILFVFSYWILWGQLIKCFNMPNNRRLFTLFLCCYCLIKIMTTVNQPVDEYDNILFGSKSYQERTLIFNTTFKESEY